MKKFGWNRVRKGPAKSKRLTYYYVNDKTRHMSYCPFYLTALRRRGYNKADIIKFYKHSFGKYAPSNKRLNMWYHSFYDRFSVDISEADTLILGELSCESDLDR